VVEDTVDGTTIVGGIEGTVVELVGVVVVGEYVVTTVISVVGGVEVVCMQPATASSIRIESINKPSFRIFILSSTL
jgi:hypothetical protein